MDLFIYNLRNTNINKLTPERYFAFFIHHTDWQNGVHTVAELGFSG